ncbi:glycoside hydrolase family 19 protein [Xenorhabdus bovienii]|uniref:glycoside hydrolase family 19 protein n=1 Tax=Xenorhabdus bovienii TaxID=40576 RepID=UPI0023B31588|nr:hypothetical protein [Xenorhabdus bovienii]MDE9453427.1 hypothetical protein [Xenorhabdus bovienii]
MSQLEQSDCINCPNILKQWVEFQLVDEEGRPLVGMPYKLKSRGNPSFERTGTTDGAGLLREKDLPPMPVILSISAQPLADEIVKRTPRQKTGEANSHVKPTAILEGHEYQYITLGMLSDGYPTIRGWQAQELQNSEHFSGSTLQGLSTHQLKRRHVLEMQVIQGCACDRDITLAELQEILPNAPQIRLQNNLEAFNQGFNRFGITTCRGKAHFLAQVCHESGGLQYTKEIGGERKNYNPWYGRGLIQLTFEGTYTEYGDYIDEDVTSSAENRDKLLSPPHSVLSAFWFYNIYKNVFGSAGNDDFNKVTALINGGFNGYNDRLNYLKTAIRVLRAGHLNQLLENGRFEFTSSSIYNYKIYSFAWGLWHDPNITTRRGTTKDRDEALRGYERVQTLITENPFRTEAQLNRRMYGIKNRDVSNYINERIAALRAGEGGARRGGEAGREGGARRGDEAGREGGERRGRGN